MDNKLPDNQNNQPNSTQEGTVPTVAVSSEQSSSPPQAAPPASPPPPPSTVVVPEKKEGLPLWFYILFATVSLVFLFTTFLLIKTILEKRNMEDTNQAEMISPTPVPQATETPVSPTPTDEFINAANSINDTDEVATIEGDLNNTQTEGLREDLDQFDASLNP